MTLVGMTTFWQIAGINPNSIRIDPDLCFNPLKFIRVKFCLSSISLADLTRNAAHGEINQRFIMTSFGIINASW